MQQLHPWAKKIVPILAQRSDAFLSEFRHNLNHHLNVLEWMERLQPKLDDVMAVAGLLHDCDRFFEQQRVRKDSFKTYEAYKAAHAQRCAEIAVDILTELEFPKEKLSAVRELITDHEWGRTPPGALLMTADSLSYFEHNIFDYLLKNGLERTKQKMVFMGTRLDAENQARIVPETFPFLQVPELREQWGSITSRKS